MAEKRSGTPAGAVASKQAEDLGSRLIAGNISLPAVVAYYQRLRDVYRVSMLRTIKYSALALRFWGLRDVANFSSPYLLSNVDQLEAHMDVLLNEYEYIASQFGSYTLSTCGLPVNSRGILYRLTDEEVAGLRISIIKYVKLESVGVLAVI
ncbi:hypothetical protein ACJ41O_005516 [Fusarium nematophilum]